MLNRARSALAVAVLAFAACAESVPVDRGAVAEWSLSATPRVSIGVADGDDRYTFRRIVGAALAASGGLWVADAEPALTYYDSTGAFVRRSGRKGSGPGEFQVLFTSPFAYQGDSIAVWDFGPRRLSIFGPTGEFARAAQVILPLRRLRPGYIPAGSCCRVEHALSAGSFVLEYPASIPNAPGPLRHSMSTLVRVAPDGGRVDTIGEFESAVYRFDDAAPNGIRDVHLTSWLTFAVVGDTVFGGNGQEPLLLRIVPGQAPDTIPLRVVRRPVTPQLKDSLEVSYRAEFARRPKYFEGPIEESFEGEYATSVPVYRTVMSDKTGNLWLGQWRVPFSSDPWWFHVYTTTGRMIARISMPTTARIADIRGSRIALIERDSLDVEYVRVYDIIRERN